MTFKPNGGAPAPNTQQVVAGTPASEPEAPSKEGYRFAGWLAPNGGLYNFATPVTSSLVLAASWEAEKYSIVFDPSGGSVYGSDKPVTSIYNYNEVITMPTPSREGYTFLYWKGSEYRAGESYTIVGDHTFVAQWKKDSGMSDEPGATDETKQTNRSDAGEKAEGVQTQPNKEGSSTGISATGDQFGLIAIVLSVIAAGMLAAIILVAVLRRSRK